MEEWKEYELGELITLNSGGTPDKSNKSYWGGDIPWISAKFMYDDYLYSSELKISQEGLDNGSRLASCCLPVEADCLIVFQFAML